jgi:demethylmenaquinone methyltransferase/2-methoxy-6-polyprenyl-1,4-benzoquinol methylase
MPSRTVSSAASVQALFDRIAPDYDRLNTVLSLGLHRIWKGMTVRWSRPPLGGTAIDLCCGSGDLALELARLVGPTGRVYGLDFSPRMLAIAERRAKLALLRDRLTWLQGDALHLPFADNRFAAATMGYGLRNLVDISQSLRELQRVLAPGAWAAILDFQPLSASQASCSVPATFQQIYLAGIVVPVATALGLESEYTYIQDSLQAFPTAAEQVRLAQTAGFANCHVYPIAGGLMGVLVVQKPHP